MNYTAAQIAAALGVSKQAVSHRSRKESWPSQKRKGKGGGKAFPMSSLPEDVRTALVTQTARGAVASEECTALELAQTAPVAKRSLIPAAPKVAQSITLDIPRKQKAMLRADLVRHYTASVARAANKGYARDGFIQAYHAGAYPELLRELGPTSWKTIERWKVAMQRTGDAFTLADRRGLAQRGQSSLTDAMKQAVLRLALHPNRVRLSTCISMTQKMLVAQGSEYVPSDATFRRFLNTFQKRNQDVWVFCREGQKAKKHQT